MRFALLEFFKAVDKNTIINSTRTSLRETEESLAPILISQRVTLIIINYYLN